MINEKAASHIRSDGMYNVRLEERQRILEGDGFRMETPAEYVLIGGCALPAATPELRQALMGLLGHLEIDYTMLAKEYCCGWMPIGQPAVMARDETDIAASKELAEGFIRQNFRQAEALGARSIVLFCAACEPSYTNNVDATNLEVISYSDLLDRFYQGGKLDMEADYYAGCYRFRRRITPEPVSVEAAERLLAKVDGLKVNYLDNGLCCFKPQHLEELVGSLSSRELIAICNGCYQNLERSLQGKGDYRVRLLPEILWDAVQ